MISAMRVLILSTAQMKYFQAIPTYLSAILMVVVAEETVKTAPVCSRLFKTQIFKIRALNGNTK